jgi:hypothetical protein
MYSSTNTKIANSLHVEPMQNAKYHGNNYCNALELLLWCYYVRGAWRKFSKFRPIRRLQQTHFWPCEKMWNESIWSEWECVTYMYKFEISESVWFECVKLLREWQVKISDLCGCLLWMFATGEHSWLCLLSAHSDTGLSPISDHSNIRLKSSQSDIICDILLKSLAISDTWKICIFVGIYIFDLKTKRRDSG